MIYREVLRTAWAERRGFLARRASGQPAPGAATRPAPPPAATAVAPPRRLRQQVFERLLRDVESQGAGDLGDPAAMRARVHRILSQALATRDAPALSREERQQIETDLLHEVAGFGPLEPLFADPTLSDILVNGPHEVWVDRFGRLERTSIHFDDEEHLMRLLSRVVAAHGRHLDEASPLVDVRLADGSRLHAVIPPLSAQGPVVSIRRARSVPFRIEQLYACGTLSAGMGRFLEAAVRCGLNIVISGGAASGKTTLLNVLSRFIPAEERIVTIEETAELELEHPHVIALEARLPNIEGRGEVTVRSLVRNALRMRADRLIVGEVRGAEVFDMLQAMNTGHDGSLTTVHANSPEDALRRLENLVLMGGFELPSRAIRELLGAAFQVIVQMRRFPDGSRKITSVRELRRDLADGGLTTVELFRFARQRSADPGALAGRHVATGERPTFLGALTTAGFDLEALFGARRKKDGRREPAKHLEEVGS